jgi:hypothetical protein
VAKISVVSNTAGGRRAWHADPQVLTIPPQDFENALASPAWQRGLFKST